ncbi:Predicted O-linked N-acetylglucosamine transferase, SPINDLY family [Enhydrobacter aerosaccus]|uniref:protein O-GlcNAc transferase n=1 Tax=Enhydrobacter aerosaccus TaxID=225324 RepID=A0A1T4QQH0_9HYPH|nr:tetratricopeptide repeat protein [Enhydrobacter aerosaccus]SKA06013.1 Predicted O-linked N-acetylglucosamine transferase, SPINDLY family [Enhydrobacter aerosaccus]
METADPAVAFEQGFALHRQGRLDEAERCYRSVLAGQPSHFHALHFTGLIHYQRGAHAEAADWIERAIAVDPKVPEAHSNLGLALQELQRFDEALACHQRALELEPDAAESLNNRGNVLLALNRPEEALADYDEALRRNPDFALAHNNRGNALQALGRVDEALAAYDRALQLMPDFVLALNHKGRILREMKRLDEAAAVFGRLLTLAPQLPYLPGMLFDTRLNACQWQGYDAAAAAIISAIRRGERADAPFTFFNYSLVPADQLLCARAFAAADFPPSPRPLVTGRPVRRDRIRLAYLSPDFRQHATAYLTAGLFEHHHRSHFEVFGISYGPDDQSPMRARLQAGFDRFIDVREHGDRAVAELLHQEGIDIAVDLAGYTALNRAGILAHRPAPIQVLYLGFPATMGTSFIDYLIADHQVIPPQHEPAYSEKIVRLPDSYQVNDNKRAIAEQGPSRRELGLPDRAFVFCSFNNSYKIRPAIFDVWMRLLRAVEGSVLWLLDDNPFAIAAVRREAQQRGVSPNRLVFAPRVPLDQHLARHRCADLFLDTFPCNAHTTASDALWVGLPLITLTGDTFASRVAASLLNAVGLPELVTTNLAEYEALAFKLATTPDLLAETKGRLEAQRSQAPLFDTGRTCRHLESAYIEMYERCLRGDAPSGFDVAALP